MVHVQCYKMYFTLSQGNKVVFNKDGTRKVDTVAVLQHQFSMYFTILLYILFQIFSLPQILDNSGDLVRTTVATVSYSGGVNEYTSANSMQFPGKHKCFMCICFHISLWLCLD